MHWRISLAIVIASLFLIATSDSASAAPRIITQKHT